MSPKIILSGKSVVKGIAEGEALVTNDTISGWGGVDPLEGTIIEKRHELNNKSIKNKILVFRGAKGSSGFSNVFHIMRLEGVGPKAMIFEKMTTKIALGAVVLGVPTITSLNKEPTRVINSGDFVKVNANEGVVELY